MFHITATHADLIGKITANKLKSVKLNPFDGLKQIDIEEYRDTNSFDLYNKVERLAPSFQEGQTSDLFLFLYFLNILSKANVEFLVKGGIILNAILGKHARRTKDVDVFVKDPDVFFKEVNDALLKYSGPFIFKTRWIRKKEADQAFYHSTFSFLVSAYHEDILMKDFIVDGTYIDDYERLERIRYDIPRIVDEKGFFYGVSPEYVAAQKVVAVVNDLKRPVKHLVDLYSLINHGLNVDEFKRWTKRELDKENHVRKNLGVGVLIPASRINKDKEFLDSYYFTVISAGYNIDKDDMVEHINNYLLSYKIFG